MSHIRRARCVVLLSCCTAFIPIASLVAAQAPSRAATLIGTVTDPSGARLPHASVHLRGPSLSDDFVADELGTFSVALPSGDYELTVNAPGFSPFIAGVHLFDQSTIRVNVPLRIAVREEAIAVPSDNPTSANDNASAIVFNAADLQTFSTDDATFQKELLALAGTDGKPPAVFVDGFSGGRFPPKNTIASIRLNRNLYSALYDTLGFGRVEVSTKPGGEKLHGQLNLNSTEKALNAQNPYIVGTQPSYYVLNLDGNLSGSINRKTAFFLSGVSNNQQNNAALNAITLNGAGQQVAYSAAVRDPILTSTFGLRLDRTLSSTNNLTARYEFNQVSQTNGGLLTPLTTADQAYNSGTTAQTLQLSDTQFIGLHMLYESRFQYVRTRLRQDAAETGTSHPTLIVEGGFFGGGNPAQSLQDNQDHFEFQQAFSIDRGKHYLRFGARYRLQRDANLSTANYNGQWTFPSLAAYAANQASQYSITTGQASASVLTGDLGAYAEDEWHVTRNLTLDLGFRFESQSAIPDHVDPAPRIGVAWALHRNGQKSTFLTLRAGGGIFYGRFAASDLLTTIRQNGISQQTYIVASNLNYPTPPDMSTISPQPAIYRLAPHLITQYGYQGGGSAEKTFGRLGSATINYVFTRGVHQFITRNINAPLPGTYDPAVPNSGTRPFGGTQNIYEFDSNGIQKSQTLILNARLMPVKGLNLTGVYIFSISNTNANGTNTFPTDSYNLSADYGHAGNEQPQQVYFGGNYSLPFGFGLGAYGSFQSGVPFDITTGTDLNGDSIYNDRPAFATAPTANSLLYKTRFGTLDANPQPGEPIVPNNFGRSPSFVDLDLSLSRGFSFGSRPAAAAGKPAPHPAPRPDPPYSILFTLSTSNVFNHRNPGPPVGVLSSPYFGQSLSLGSIFSTITAANRVVFLQSAFHF